MDNAASNHQQILDNEHLKLLSIFHYVKGGITALFSCIPIILRIPTQFGQRSDFSRTVIRFNSDAVPIQFGQRSGE